MAASGPPNAMWFLDNLKHKIVKSIEQLVYEIKKWVANKGITDKGVTKVIEKYMWKS